MKSQNQLKLNKAIPSFQQVLESDCDVCFVPFNRVTPRKIEEGLQILFCSQCYIHVHKCCYDFEPQLTVVTDKISEFLCDRCRSEELKVSKCIVCYGEEGAMKKIGEKQVVHVYCGLIHNDIQIMTYYPSIIFRRSPYYEETHHSCEVCHQKNAHQQCAQDSCRRKIHVYCAKKTYNALSKESDEPKCWNHHISGGSHGNFDLSDELITEDLFGQQVDGQIRQIQSLGLELTGKDTLKKRIHREYLQQQRSRRKNNKKLRRGGFSYVLCPTHESVSYCSCYNKSDGEDMVLCQCCFEWFHHKCVNYQGQEDSYLCQYCKTFYQFKRKAVEEMKSGRSEYDVARIQTPLKVSVSDFMWVMRVVDLRIRGGLAAKMVKELVKYPLKSSCMQLLIKHLNRNKLTALADECLVQLAKSQLTGGLRPRRVLGTQPDGRAVVLSVNVEYNRLVRKGIEQFMGMGIRVEGFVAILKELEFKERALTDSYEQIIELSKVEQQYQEVQILKQKAQAYDFVQIVRKIQQELPVSLQELDQSLRKAESCSHLPRYLFDTLQQKYNQVAPIVQSLKLAIANSPQNTYQISQFYAQLQEQNILPPTEYQQLSSEKKLVQNLYLYFAKQQGGKMDEQLTTQERIEALLTCNTLKPSQEMVDIINAYNPTQTQPIWPSISSLIQKYQALSIQFQLKEIIKRKYTKQEKFLHVVQKTKHVNSQIFSEEVKALLANWAEIKANYDELMSQSMDNLTIFEDMCQISYQAGKVVDQLQNFVIKLEEESNRSMYQLAKARKDQIQQLKVLYTESQFPKNPLSLSKLLPTLPKHNSLVKQWHNLKKQQANFMNKFTSVLAKISERLQFFKNQKKLQRKQQIKQNSEKPTINDISQLIQILKHSRVDMSKQIKQLTRSINNSLQIASKVKRYLEEKGDVSHSNLDQLSNKRKEIDQLRKKVLTVAELCLKMELQELYHAEICNRMRTSLISPTLELQKISALLKFAEEENLTHLQTYKALKDKFDSKNQKSKEITLLKNLQQNLAIEAGKDMTFNFSNLYLYRRSFALPQLPEIKPKISFVEELIDKNRQLREKIARILQQRPQKWEINEARTVFLEALKNPYIIPDIARLSVQITKASDLMRKWKDIGRSFNHLHPIFLDYELLSFTIEEIETVKREIKNNQEQIQRLNRLVGHFEEGNRDQLQEIIERIEGANVLRESEICKQAQKNYIKYWIKLLQSCKKSKRIVPYQKVRRLLLDSYNLLQKGLKYGEEIDDLKPTIYDLQDYMILIKSHLKSYPTHASGVYIADTFIDLEELYLEHDDEDQDIADCVPILRPFSDLAKFKMRNLQRLEVRREELNFKRSRDKLDDLRGESEKNIPAREPSESSQSIPQVVSENQRKKIKQIFLKNIRKNPELRKYGECQNQVKMIQNQIFGEWHNDIVKYFQTSQDFQKLFIKLISCPNISNKLAKKKFEFKFIQILVSNLQKIDQLEAMILNKIKEQENQKAITKISEVISEKPLPQFQRNNQESLMETLVSGKVDESTKQDLKKEMKLLKEMKEANKHKKKKHKHRSRSRSPDAKFSSDSEKQLPSYIQNEYNKDEKAEKKQESILRPEESPLRYDPQQQEIASTVLYPRGSLLHLKTCDLEILTRKRGKVQFPVQLITEQEHKKLITDFFDPGFTRLSVKKDKNQAEIIQYISKSKKKYKYIICWFQAKNPDDNELLKDISQDANQKKKIFGWQNQHIKIHIMSIKQFVQIGRFAPPSRVSSAHAANVLNQQRLMIILQYPQKIYEVKDNYKPFGEIQKKNQEFTVAVPVIAVQALPTFDFYPKYTMPTIEPLNKPNFEETKPVYEGGWGNDGIITLPTPPPQPMPIQPSHPQSIIANSILAPLNIQQQPPPQTNNLPHRVNLIRIQLGFSHFDPILTDEEDEGDDRRNGGGDLASDLLNSLGDLGQMQQPTQQPPAREKPVPAPPAQQQQQQQQQYQGYYGNYSYQPPPPPRQIPQQQRWMGYSIPQHQAPVPTQHQHQPQVYNPLNPMASKYPPQIPPPIMNPAYKNPLAPGQQPRPQGMSNPYYHPPGSGQGYDPRYQGGYQQ